MWRIWHKLFGWDYVRLIQGTLNDPSRPYWPSQLCRIQVDKSDRPYIMMYSDNEKKKDYIMAFDRIPPENLIWLTGDPDKYKKYLTYNALKETI